jgi:hypothetical protein
VAQWDCLCAQELAQICLDKSNAHAEAMVQQGCECETALMCLDQTHNICGSWKEQHCIDACSPVSELLQNGATAKDMTDDDLLSLVLEGSKSDSKAGWNCG